MTDETSPDHAVPGSAAPEGPTPEGQPTPEGRVTPEPQTPEPQVTPGPRPRTVQYKGGDLEAERGPGLGCFWAQVVVLGFLIVLTPISVSLGWPSEVSAILLFVTIGLLLLTGQTIIFLLRLVAADRRGRRRPLASETKTVGELEDEHSVSTALSGGDAIVAEEPNARDDVRQ